MVSSHRGKGNFAGDSHYDQKPEDNALFAEFLAMVDDEESISGIGGKYSDAFSIGLVSSWVKTVEAIDLTRCQLPSVWWVLVEADSRGYRSSASSSLLCFINT